MDLYKARVINPDKSNPSMSQAAYDISEFNNINLVHIKFIDGLLHFQLMTRTMLIDNLT